MQHHYFDKETEWNGGVQTRAKIMNRESVFLTLLDWIECYWSVLGHDCGPFAFCNQPNLQIRLVKAVYLGLIGKFAQSRKAASMQESDISLLKDIILICTFRIVYRLSDQHALEKHHSLPK